MSLFGSSINQNTQTHTPSLFGNSTTNQPQQSNNAFGSTFGAAKPQQPGSLFGSTTTQNAPQQSGSLFGSSTTLASQPQQSTSPFGATATSQPQQSGSLFGATAAAQPQQMGNSFGSTTATSQAQQSNNLFGGALTGQQQQTQPQQSTSLFGAPTQNTQTGGSLFGNTTASQAKPTLSLFGNTQGQQTQQSTPSLFGAATTTTQANAQPSLFGTFTNTATSQPQQSSTLFGSSFRPGGLTLGQSGTNQQPGGGTNSQSTSTTTIPGVRIDLSNIRGTTRFNDLHDDLQAQITQIDAFIQQQISYQEQCAALMPAHADTVASIPSDVDYVKQKLDTVELALDNDSSAIEQMKRVVRKDAQNARLSFKAIENLKLPQQFHYTGMSWHGGGGPTGNTPTRGATNGDASEAGSPEDIVSYFSAEADDFQKTLDIYTRNIAEIESHLGAVESNVVQQSQQVLFKKGTDGGVRTKEEQVRELAAVLNEFEGAIIGVAERIGQLREGTSDLVEASKGGVTYASGSGSGSGWRR